MKRDRASELRAIADGRLMLNVRNGVTVSRSMLAMIADEIDALRSAPLTPAEVGGLVERLRALDGAILSTAAGEAAAALEAQAAELAAVHQRYVDANEARIDAEAQLAEARKAQNYLNDAVFAGLDHLEIARRAKILANAARRAREQGGENG